LSASSASNETPLINGATPYRTMRLPRQQQKPNQIAERIHQRDDLCR